MKRSRIGSAVAGALALVVAGAPLAGAQVTVSSDSAAPGSDASLTFRVSNERAEASTTAVEVDFPADHPLRGVSVLSKPGWTFSTVEAAPTTTASPMAIATASPSQTPPPSPTATISATPAVDMGGMSGMGGMHGHAYVPGPSTDDEATTPAIASITWHINSAVSAIPPGGYDLFTVRVPQLPTDTDTLTFQAVQTYSSGEVVRWTDQAAPTLQLSAATATATATPTPTSAAPPGGMTMTSTPMAGDMSMDMGPSRDDTVNVALGLGIAGLFLGLVAGTLGGAALVRSRGAKSGD
jgi:uncharacterized protein YcnI